MRCAADGTHAVVHGSAQGVKQRQALPGRLPAPLVEVTEFGQVGKRIAHSRTAVGSGPEHTGLPLGAATRRPRRVVSSAGALVVARAIAAGCPLCPRVVVWVGNEPQADVIIILGIALGRIPKRRDSVADEGAAEADTFGGNDDCDRGVV